MRIRKEPIISEKVYFGDKIGLKPKDFRKSELLKKCVPEFNISIESNQGNDPSIDMQKQSTTTNNHYVKLLLVTEKNFKYYVPGK